jgi:D-amino-acid dehydrogenase
MKTVAVVGAGIAGLTSAYYLARAGYQVSVYDKEHYPAMQCSYANGGQVSVSNSQTWNTWSNVIKGLKWLGRKDAPLLIKPSLDWDKAKWLAKFLKHTANNEWARNTADTIRLGIRARELYDFITRDYGLEYDRVNTGILHIYKTQEYMNDAMLLQELYESNGCEWRIISSAFDIGKIEPSLKDVNGIIGGIYTKSDFTGDIHKFCTEMFKILNTTYGVRFFFDRLIEKIKELHHYDHIVIANGSDARHLSKQVGDNHPIYPVKGYSITINLDEKSAFHAPYTSLLDDEAKIVTSRFKNRLRVAGTAEITGDNWDIRKDRIDPLLKWVHKNFPKINTENYSSWACLRPMTPNMMPIVKQSSKDHKVFYHIGHGHLGWTLAPATAEILVKIIQGKQ